MKVSISVPGRFHAFALARQLDEKGYLDRLVTSFPAFEVRKYGIPVQKVKSVVSKEVIQRGIKKLTGQYPENGFLNHWFDTIASYKLPADSNIYVMWAGFASHTIQRLRKKNPKAVFILERGSAHIEVQNNLLKTFEKNREPIHPSVRRKEEKEYELADFIAVPGLFAKESFIQQGIPEKKLFVNHYGVDLSAFRPTGKERKANADVFTIGYAGAISNQKNVRGTINACRILKEKGYKVKLILAGSLDNNSFKPEELQQDFIDYKGSLPENQLPGIYEQMDAFVLNSIQDGFGMVLLQAMAMGVVPIASRNTGGPDVITHGENGFLVPILDDNALANCIETLINNPAKRISMAARALETVQHGFSWQDYGNRAIGFYQAIMDKS